MDLLNAKLKFEIESSMAAAELKLLKGEIDDISSGQKVSAPFSAQHSYTDQQSMLTHNLV